ncbi:MAG: alpha/beta fold hydrolase [Chitinophagaceae bacterium]|nr:alpha/beta fold hydrolase [Chitinophagaceae bacterium]
MLHNFFGTADQWKPYVEAYSKQFRTIAIDMMGHGRSDIYNKGATFFNHGDYAKIIIALLDSLQLNKVHAIGGSSGGMTLLHLNVMQPERFKYVIAVGAQIYFSRQCRDWVTQIGLNNFMEWAKPHGAEKQPILAGQFWQMRDQYGDPSFTPDMLNTIKASWLVVQGDNDESVPLQQALEMHKYIPNSRLWVVPNG